MEFRNMSVDMKIDVQPMYNLQSFIEPTQYHITDKYIICNLKALQRESTASEETISAHAYTKDAQSSDFCLECHIQKLSKHVKVELNSLSSIELKLLFRSNYVYIHYYNYITVYIYIRNVTFSQYWSEYRPIANSWSL